MGRAYIVTDLGFGDSGKGSTVDFLARHSEDPLVIRHSGGAQASSEVHTLAGQQHRFTHFSSATFVPHARSYFSRFCVLNPLDMMFEEHQLRECGISDAYDRTCVDAEALIVTPWHRATNRIRETLRGELAHGSTGQGVGEAVSDARDVPHLALHAGEVSGSHLSDRLREIRDYKYEQLVMLARNADISVEHLDSSLFCDNGMVEQLAHEYKMWADRVRIVGYQSAMKEVVRSRTVICEGAGGVLLDEWYGFYPHTMWNTTTHDNALTILDEMNWSGDVMRLGVTRTYATRHGRGPLVTYDSDLQNECLDDLSENIYQGELRVGWLDMVLLRYAVEAARGIDGIVMTSCDVVRSPWKICTAYDDVESFSGEAYSTPRGHTRLEVRRTRDIDRQCALGRALDFVHPVYQRVHGIEELEAVMQETLHAPVVIRSYGATEGEKYSDLFTSARYSAMMNTLSDIL